MNELDEASEALLAAARRGLLPRAGTAERVFGRTITATEAPATIGGAEAARAGGPLAKVVGSAAFKLGAALSIAVVSGAVGYLAGFTAGTNASHARRDDQPTARALAPTVAVRAPVKPPSSGERAQPASSLAPSPAVPGAPPKAPSRARARPLRAGSATSAEPVHAEARGPALVESLEIEVRALRAVERALREDQPRLAFELLADLDRTVPGGALAEERSAAFLMARCALGLGTPARLLREFTELHPDSVHYARVKQACERP